jgi:hypothetical protein
MENETKGGKYQKKGFNGQVNSTMENWNSVPLKPSRESCMENWNSVPLKPSRESCRDGGVVQVVECLPYKDNTLSSISSTIKKKKTQKKNFVYGGSESSHYPLPIVLHCLRCAPAC